MQKNSLLSRLDFFLGGSYEDIVKTFNINAETPKFYSSTVVYFTLADLLETKKSPRGQVQGLLYWNLIQI